MAGKLDRRITIERLTEGALNDFNEPSETWNSFAVRWASRSDVSDGQRVNAGVEMSALMARFEVRSDPETRTITTEDRINGEGGFWDIVGVKEAAGDSHQFLEITAQRRSE